jgi:CMP-N,N'-diacetyllegionaminic acid synthase
MNILFTVCGRAGSKGCKNKNMKEFLESPLLYYTLSNIDLFINRNKENYNVDICVNSDSKELLNLVRKLDMEVTLIDRNLSLAKDNTPKVDVIKSSVEECEKLNDTRYDYVIDLDITSPLRTVKDIENAIKEKERARDKDIIFSVVEARRNPYFNMVENKNGNYKLIVETNYVTRQEAPITYDMNASIYVYERECLKDEKLQTLFEGPCGIIEMRDTGILDIDSEYDFELMEVIAEYFFKSNKEFGEVKENIEKILK